MNQNIPPGGAQALALQSFALVPKIQDLLQPDRFEEDLGISRLRVRAPTGQPVPKPPPPMPHPTEDPEELERRRIRGLNWIAELRRGLA